MKFIITEEQYNQFRKSTIKRFLRRVSHRLDEIVDSSIEHVLDFLSRGHNSHYLTEIRVEGFANRVVFDTFEYIYESYIEPDVYFSDEEQDIIKDYLHDRYDAHIRDKYLTYLSDNNLNESKELSREDKYQIKWKRFETFMKRRDDEIKDYISQHTHAYTYDIDRYDEYVIVTAVINMVVNDFIINNELLDEDDLNSDWIYQYITDNYTSYIKKEIGFI
jgi:hypothetical protein